MPEYLTCNGHTVEIDPDLDATGRELFAQAFIAEHAPPAPVVDAAPLEDAAPALDASELEAPDAPDAPTESDAPPARRRRTT